MPLVLAGATSGQATVQATDAQTVTITMPATSGTLALTSGGGSPSFTSITTTNDSSISGLTVGKGGGSVASNTVVGNNALAATATGIFNTAVGASALAANTSGQTNTAVGQGSLYANTTGSSNTGLGQGSLLANTTGGSNTALGSGSLNANTTASNNTAVGYQAGYTNTTGIQNTLVGVQAGYSLTTGQNNTFIGTNTSTGSAGYYVTTGSKNSIFGAYNGNQGGLDIRTASNYIVLSDGDGNPQGYCDGNGKWTFGTGGTTNNSVGTIRLNGASGSGLGWFIDGLNNGTRTNLIGNYSQIAGGTATWLTLSNTGGGVYLNGATATSWTAVSDETRKDIIEPITGGLTKVATLRTVIGKLKTDEEGVRRPYLIAQDVQKVLPEAVTETEDKEGKVLGLSYTEVIPLLVNAIQELNAKVEAQAAQIAALTGAK